MSTPSVTGSGTGTGTRRDWVDNLRITVVAGVVVAHAVTAYVIDIDWYYEERTTSAVSQLVLIAPTFLAAVFGLAPLFLVAGWLAAESLARRSPAGFAARRLVRLGIPLLVFTLVLDPLSDYLGDLFDQGQPLWDFLSFRTGTTDTGPMWFVAALLVFSLVYAGLWALHPAVARASAPLDGRVVAAIASLVAVADFATWLGSPLNADTFLNLFWPRWPQSAGLFALGALAGRRGFTDVTARFSRVCGRTALAGLAALAALGVWVAASTGVDQIGGWHWEAAVFAALDGLVATTASLWLVAWFRRRWDTRRHAWGTRAARGSYAAYVIHPVVLVALSLAARPLPWPPELKLVLVAGCAVPAVFWVGYRLTRLPGIGRVL